MKKRALFVTFEGIEGVGKSTQIKAVREHWTRKGLTVLLTREPGGSPLSDGIRDVLLKSSNKLSIDPMAELLLMEAARRQHVTDVLSKGLDKYDLILCDRFTDSSLAYQGGGRGIPMEQIETLNRWATGGLTPDVTFLFDMPAEEGLKRALRRIEKSGGPGAEDRFEKEGKNFHQKVREAYLALAKKEPGRFFLIDATQSIADISKAILKHLEHRLKKTP